ncbi:hypothetical protein RRG08_050555 [Elysia crispata]|uniref:Uncharacterized protein n=1 Tax=Elysia crispata TaxID=231223 RepID=A0AAE1DB24_9GAST|nr:hypothetical protein RRG08_050555 [Elysia crispata]
MAGHIFEKHQDIRNLDTNPEISNLDQSGESIDTESEGADLKRNRSGHLCLISVPQLVLDSGVYPGTCSKTAEQLQQLETEICSEADEEGKQTKKREKRELEAEKFKNESSSSPGFVFPALHAASSLPLPSPLPPLPPPARVEHLRGGDVSSWFVCQFSGESPTAGGTDWDSTGGSCSSSSSSGGGSGGRGADNAQRPGFVDRGRQVAPTAASIGGSSRDSESCCSTCDSDNLTTTPSSAPDKLLGRKNIHSEDGIRYCSEFLHSDSISVSGDLCDTLTHAVVSGSRLKLHEEYGDNETGTGLGSDHNFRANLPHSPGLKKETLDVRNNRYANFCDGRGGSVNLDDGNDHARSGQFDHLCGGDALCESNIQPLCIGEDTGKERQSSGSLSLASEAINRCNNRANPTAGLNCSCGGKAVCNCLLKPGLDSVPNGLGPSLALDRQREESQADRQTERDSDRDKNYDTSPPSGSRIYFQRDKEITVGPQQACICGSVQALQQALCVRHCTAPGSLVLTTGGHCSGQPKHPSHNRLRQASTGPAAVPGSQGESLEALSVDQALLVESVGDITEPSHTVGHTSKVSFSKDYPDTCVGSAVFDSNSDSFSTQGVINSVNFFVLDSSIKDGISSPYQVCVTRESCETYRNCSYSKHASFYKSREDLLSPVLSGLDSVADVSISRIGDYRSRVRARRTSTSDEDTDQPVRSAPDIEEGLYQLTNQSSHLAANSGPRTSTPESRTSYPPPSLPSPPPSVPESPLLAQCQRQGVSLEEGSTVCTERQARSGQGGTRQATPALLHRAALEDFAPVCLRPVLQEWNAEPATNDDFLALETYTAYWWMKIKQRLLVDESQTKITHRSTVQDGELARFYTESAGKKTYGAIKEIAN